MEIRRPNEEGSTMCIVRYLVDTPAGWIGAYDRAALEHIAALEVRLKEALARITESAAPTPNAEFTERQQASGGIDGSAATEE